MADNNELTIETVTALPVDQLNDDHKNFLKDNQDKLNDEQKKTYGGFFGNKDDDGGDDDGFNFEDDNQSPPDLDDKKNKKVIKKDDNDLGDDDDLDDDDLDDKDKSVIAKTAQKVAEQALEPIMKANEIARVKSEWEKTFSSFPELAKFETKILRYANHPSYKGKSINQAIVDVAGLDIFVKIGAKRARTADVDADKDKNNGGGGGRNNDDLGDKGVNNSGVGSFKGLSGADIQKKIADMRRAGTYRER